ncbi:MAG: glutathione S-transferase family protein [Paracoccaceae bacterium]
MTESLTFYTHPQSRGRTARWMLEETGVPYDTVLLDYRGSMKAPDYLAVNPMGKVPAIIHGRQVVTEGAAICAYLADAFPKAGLGPKAEERGAYYRALFFASGPLEAAIVNRALKVELTEEQQGFVGYGSFERTMTALEAMLKQSDFAAGDRFTAADVYLGAQIGFGLRFGTIDGRKTFTDYWHRVADRPARLRAAQIDDALLPKETPK